MNSFLSLGDYNAIQEVKENLMTFLANHEKCCLPYLFVAFSICPISFAFAALRHTSRLASKHSYQL